MTQNAKTVKAKVEVFLDGNGNQNAGAEIPDDVVREEEMKTIFVPPTVKNDQIVFSLVDVPIRPRKSGQITNLYNLATINEKKKSGKYYGRTVGTFRVNGIPMRLEVELQVNGWELKEPEHAKD